MSYVLKIGFWGSHEQADTNKKPMLFPQNEIYFQIVCLISVKCIYSVTVFFCSHCPCFVMFDKQCLSFSQLYNILTIEVPFVVLSLPISYISLVYFAGQPKRHLLTTGWSVFVSAKRLVTGDSVIFIRFYSSSIFQYMMIIDYHINLISCFQERKEPTPFGNSSCHSTTDYCTIVYVVQ